MSEFRDKILRVVAEEKPTPAECVAVPVSVGALYAARMNIAEPDFLSMCRRALISARKVWTDHDKEGG